MDSLMDFLRMGGYGWYVWSAFGITAITLTANIVYAYRKKHNALRRKERQNC